MFTPFHDLGPDGLRLMAESIPQFFWICLPDGSAGYINKRFADYVGKTGDELFPTGWLEVLHPQDVDRTVQKWMHCVETQEPFESEYRMRRFNDGTYRWFQSKGFPVKDQSGQVIRWMGTSTDIDDHKRSTELLQLVMDNIPEAVFWKDRQSNYLGCNKAFAIKAGLGSPEEIVGKTDYDMSWKKEESDFFRECDRIVMDNDRPEYHIIEPLLQSDGKQALIDTSKIPLHDADGNVIGIIGMFQDITEREALLAQREDYMAALAHDLKVPIVASLRAFEALESEILGPLSPPQKEFIQKLSSSHTRLLEMLKTLLDVLKNDSNFSQPHLAPTDLGALVADVVTELEPLARAKSGFLVFEAPQQKLTVSIDQDEFRRLIANLISNAIKFTPPDEAITISVKETDDHVRLSVHNWGATIAEQDQERIFDRFWHGKMYGADTGLGLYLCKQIATMHGGSIMCESSEQKGTTFTVTIPKNSSPPRPAAIPRSALSFAPALPSKEIRPIVKD